MLKYVSPPPEMLNAAVVKDICSLSACISCNFTDYIEYWRHNGYWLFDTPAAIRSLADEHSISLQGTTLFYYETYELQYDDFSGQWKSFEPEAAFVTNVQCPAKASLKGFDVVTFFAGTTPEHSPLSCNGLATEIATNSHCLFPDFETAYRVIEEGRFKNSEPGPFRIIAVYAVEDFEIEQS